MIIRTTIDAISLNNLLKRTEKKTHHFASIQSKSDQFIPD